LIDVERGERIRESEAPGWVRTHGRGEGYALPGKSRIAAAGTVHAWQQLSMTGGSADRCALRLQNRMKILYDIKNAIKLRSN